MWLHQNTGQIHALSKYFVEDSRSINADILNRTKQSKDYSIMHD